MISEIKKITYRGFLKSCNYTCFYCPFSKNSINKKEIEKDKESLNKFIEKLESIKFNEPIDLLCTPYGEAFIHDYYQKAISYLSKKTFINKIGIQTNLSLDIKKWLNLDSNFDKIFIWATYHDSMTNINEFSRKVEELNKYHKISVGVVGNPEDIEVIKDLRKKLPIDVYMWINKMDGLNRKYTNEEFEFFLSIDPMFINEFNKKNEDCNAFGSDIFIIENGEILNCNRSRKKLGNIYEDNFTKSNICNKKCDCYLAYSHKKNFSDFFGENYLFRVPEKIKPKAIFFDIDGTLIENREKLIEVFEYLSKKTNIYFATQLPINVAIRKMNFLKEYISGGVFAGGSYITDYKKKFTKVIEIQNSSNSLEEVLKDSRSRIYKAQNKIYRILTNEKYITNNHKKNFHCLKEHDDFVSIIKKDVNKFTGILEICNLNNISPKDIMCVGNDTCDLEMIKECGYSIAVIKSDESIKNEAKYCMNVSGICFVV